jgi:hypothetical protein
MSNPITFRKAVEAGDLDEMMAQFAEDAVLHSPVTFKPFEGKAAIRQLLTILFETFQDFRYTDELEAEDGTRALIFRSRVGDRDLQGLDLIRFDESGLIRDLTVMIRPRSAIEALLAAVGPRLAAARGSA